MRDELRSLAQGLELNEAATADAVASVQAELEVTFPQDLTEFLSESNGAEGALGDEGYLSLFKIEDLVELNEIWREGWPEKQLVMFGSDGGGETYAIDTSTDPPRIMEVPFGSVDPAHQRVVGTSLADLLRYQRGEGMLGSEDRPLRP